MICRNCDEIISCRYKIKNKAYVWGEGGVIYLPHLKITLLELFRTNNFFGQNIGQKDTFLANFFGTKYIYRVFF